MVFVEPMRGVACGAAGAGRSAGVREVLVRAVVNGCPARSMLVRDVPFGVPGRCSVACDVGCSSVVVSEICDRPGTDEGWEVIVNLPVLNHPQCPFIDVKLFWSENRFQPFLL